MSSYRDPARTREYQRQWVARRRQAALAGKSCEWCGSTDRLEIDHIDPALKVSHTVWSWTKERREAELAKCRVLCHDCHKKRHAAPHGSYWRYRSHKCRCVECRAANRQKKRRERQNRVATLNQLPKPDGMLFGGAA